MVNLSTVTTNKKLITSIPEEALVRFYFGDFKIKKKYKSPLRSDKHPSFNWFYTHGGKLYCKDLSTGESYSTIDFIKKLFNKNYHQVVDMILEDFQSNKVSKSTLEFKPEFDDSPVIIKFTPRKYTISDLSYWKQWEASDDRLKKFNIYSPSRVWINNYEVKFGANELRFIYYNPITDKCKLYRPEAPLEIKWRNNCSNERDIQGYYQADIKNSHPKLILTKALKEIVFYDAFDIKSMASHGEGAYFLPDFIRHLKKYCETITTIYDNDNAGILGAQKIHDLHGIPYKFTPDVKNVTDWYLINKDQTKKFINELH